MMEYGSFRGGLDGGLREPRRIGVEFGYIRAAGAL
jgi:hypothetical protein